MNIANIFKGLFIAGNWHVAYRRLPEGSILSDKETPFIVINNGERFHAMDPFVFEHGGETYIFAETYDRLRSRGTIGYAKWNGDGFSKWRQVIIEPYHLSYPFIFEENGEVFIIPESFLNNDVHVYRAIEFPDKWENIGTLAENVKYVDSTIWDSKGKRYLFTYDISGGEKRLLLFKMSGLGLDLQSCKAISSADEVARPAGRVIAVNGSHIRVSQDCDGDYGKAVVFSRISGDGMDDYSEERIERVAPENITLDKPILFNGIHTYTATASFEVIDLKGSGFSIFDMIGRLWAHIVRLGKR